MKYDPKGYYVDYNTDIPRHWEYTFEEKKILNSRYLSRLAKWQEKCAKDEKLVNQIPDLFERTPLWELMGESEWKWSIRHFFIKYWAIFRYKLNML